MIPFCRLTQNNVARDSGFARPVQQSNQGGALCRTGFSTNNHDDAGMSRLLRLGQKVVAIAGDENKAILDGVLQDRIVACRWRKHVAQKNEIVTQSAQGIGQIVRNIVIEKKDHG